MRLTSLALVAALSLGCKLELPGGAQSGAAQAASATPKPETPIPPPVSPPVAPPVAPVAAPLPAAPVAGPRFSGPKITKGTALKVVEVSRDDAYFPDTAKIVGQSCTAEDTLQNNGGDFFGGSVRCSGGSYYFFKAAFELSGAMAPEAPVAAVPGPAGTPTSLALIPVGSTVKIVAFSSEDAYYPGTTYLGQTCVIETEGLRDNGGGFYGGPASCGPKKDSFYFYKVRVELVALGSGAITGPALPGARATGATIPGGSRVRIVEIDPGDAYFPDAAKIVGQSCVVKTELHNNGGNFYGGDAECGPKKDYYYFYKAAVQLERP